MTRDSFLSHVHAATASPLLPLGAVHGLQPPQQRGPLPLHLDGPFGLLGGLPAAVDLKRAQAEVPSGRVAQQLAFPAVAEHLEGGAAPPASGAGQPHSGRLPGSTEVMQEWAASWQGVGAVPALQQCLQLGWWDVLLQLVRRSSHGGGTRQGPAWAKLCRKLTLFTATS